jgi:aspartyl aminopeptidase
MHAIDPDLEVEELLRFVDASPTPFHAVATAADRLAAAGWAQVDEGDAFDPEQRRAFTVRGGSIVAWDTSSMEGPDAGFRVVGAHTDSPNLRLRPHADLVSVGWQQLAVEPYGGLLRNSWLDRDLGLAGRVAVRGSGGVEARLFHDHSALARVPQLAIHLDRSQNDGLSLNPQRHLTPVWGLGEGPGGVGSYLAEQVDADPSDLLGFDVMFHPVEPSARIGREGELVAAPRLDNLATCHAAVSALLASTGEPGPQGRVVVLFDHEEIGSTSERGAMSTLLPATLERLVLAAGGSREDHWRGSARTVIASGDMAHATHPNYPELHDPNHQIRVNGGPVLKINTNLRYATDALGEAAFRLACEQADVPVQVFVARADIPCGSTIGPMTSAQTGATTVDFGAPTLSMHSARELGGAEDPAMYAAALAAFLSPAG